MPKYLSLFSFKGETLGQLVQNPSDREAAVRELATSVGGTLEAYYLMFGPHDGCAIFEMPDTVSAAAVAITVASSGAFASLQTHELVSSNEFLEALDKAKSITSYRAPGT